MEDDIIVTTDVDKIIKFIRDKEEISMADVAKSLEIPLETVESLAELLEEEDILEIKYKFTTPYIIPSKKGIEKHLTEEQREEKPAERKLTAEIIKKTEEKPVEEIKKEYADMRGEFFAKTRSRGIPDDKALELWKKYTSAHKDFIKNKFIEKAKKEGIQESQLEEKWKEYWASLNKT